VGPKGARRVEWVWTVKGKSSFNRYDARTLEYPEADSFDWPISWYEGSLFAPVPRKSFGAGGNHAGEDMAWFREGASAFAIANGIVRMVQGAGGDWGFLVALEHRLPNGEYVMSIYGHVAWDLLVKPGDIVTKGQKIATIGNSCAVENGGYGAHLHFGISQGPFRRPRGWRKGGPIDLDIEGKTTRGEILRLAYDATRKDKQGFPALGLVVRLPDGSERLVPAAQQDLGTQVSWMQGYVPGCVGWHDPRKFISERLK
jgi:murein DD-endopeptidase MepM/ murein hydrolase activator NlpD